MRRAGFLLATAFCIALFGSSASAQTTYVWNQTGTASYTTATNWTPTRTTPATNDVLLFTNGATTTVTGVPTQTIGQFTVTLNTNVTLQAAASGNTLTIGGGGGTDLSVDAGSQLNVNTANALNINLASGATGNILGAMTFTAGAHTLTAVSASGITFNTGSIFTQGTGFTGNVFGSSGAPNTTIFASGSTFDQKAGSNPFGLSEPSSKVVFQTGSLYRITATGVTPAFSGRVYANFEFNPGSGSQSPSGGSAVSINDLTVTSGTLSIAMTGTPGHSIKGNISVASGATLNFSAVSGTMNLNGSSAQAISGSGTLSIPSGTQTISVANSAGVTLQRNVATSGPFNVVSGGVLNCGTNILSGTGTFNLQPGGTLGIGHANGITVGFPPAGNIQNLNRIFNGSANYVYNGTVAQVTGNGLPTTLNGTLTVNNSAGVTLSQNATVNGTLTLTNGNITTGANTLAVASAGTVSRTSGHIIGNLQKTFTANGTKTFEVGTANGYSPVAVNVTSGTGALTVSATEGQASFISGANRLARFWTLAGSGVTADLTFTYLATDINGTVANYKFIKNSGGNLSTHDPNGTPTTTQASINGVSSFSD